MVHFQVDDQSQTHHLLEAGLVNACVTDESQAMKGCVAEYIGDMNYRFVATPTFAQQWFKQGVNRESLRAAPALILTQKINSTPRISNKSLDSIQLNIHITLFRLPVHFLMRLRWDSAMVGCPIIKPNCVWGMAHWLRWILNSISIYLCIGIIGNSSRCS